MLRKDSKMNLVVARLVVKPVNNPLEAEAVIPGNRVRCTRQFALTAGKKPKYLSSLQVIDRYIAANVTRRCVATKI
jgi:hypothetical protein